MLDDMPAAVRASLAEHGHQEIGAPAQVDRILRGLVLQRVAALGGDR